MSHPGATSTTSPARNTCSTRSTTPSPPPATATAPRRPSSLSAFRRPADIRESSKFRHDTKDPSHHRLAPPTQAFGCERVRELVDAPAHGCIAESAHCLATPRRRAHRFPGAEKLAADGPWEGASARPARGRADAAARAARRRRGALATARCLPSFPRSVEFVHRCLSFRPDALPTRSWSRGPGGRTL